MAERRRPGALRQRAAALLHPGPGHRGRGASRLPALRHGRDRLEPPQRRLAHGPLPQGRPAARGRQGRPHAGPLLPRPARGGGQARGHGGARAPWPTRPGCPSATWRWPSCSTHPAVSVGHHRSTDHGAHHHHARCGRRGPHRRDARPDRRRRAPRAPISTRPTRAGRPRRWPTPGGGVDRPPPAAAHRPGEHTVPQDTRQPTAPVDRRGHAHPDRRSGQTVRDAGRRDPRRHDAGVEELPGQPPRHAGALPGPRRQGLSRLRGRAHHLRGPLPRGVLHGRCPAGPLRGRRRATGWRSPCGTCPSGPWRSGGHGRAGGVVVPLNAWWTSPELHYGLLDSGTSVLFVDAARLGPRGAAPGRAARPAGRGGDPRGPQRGDSADRRARPRDLLRRAGGHAGGRRRPARRRHRAPRTTPPSSTPRGPREVPKGRWAPIATCAPT